MSPDLFGAWPNVPSGDGYACWRICIEMPLSVGYAAITTSSTSILISDT